jgi:PTH2 family peptidyl-tRNA hydrolase
MSIARNIRMDSEPPPSLRRGTCSDVSDLVQPIIISLIAFALGYQANSYLRSASPVLSSGSASSNKKRKLGASAAPSVANSDSGSDSEGATNPESDSEDESAAVSSSDIASVKAGMGEEVKLVLVVNDSLKMQKGKVAAQAGHATLACALTLQAQNPRVSSDRRALARSRLML